MSGGSFNYAYYKADELKEGQTLLGAKALETIAQLMHDVEWVESCDSSWDTEMAAKWWKLVYDLCCLANHDTPNGKITPPHPPRWYPQGKQYCQYCGAEEEHWNERFKMKSDTLPNPQASPSREVHKE